MVETASEERSDRIALPRYANCFVCGCKNPIGLDITFYYSNGRIETEFTPKPEHAGYREVVHGGILAALLDETMGWTSIIARPVMCYAADLSVRYKQSAKIGERLRIFGKLVEDKKRIILASGGVERYDGTLLCSAEGKFVPLPPSGQKRVIDYAVWNSALEDAYCRIMTLRSQ